MPYFHGIYVIIIMDTIMHNYLLILILKGMKLSHLSCLTNTKTCKNILNLLKSPYMTFSSPRQVTCMPNIGNLCVTLTRQPMDSPIALSIPRQPFVGLTQVQHLGRPKQDINIIYVCPQVALQRQALKLFLPCIKNFMGHDLAIIVVSNVFFIGLYGISSHMLFIYLYYLNIDAMCIVWA